MTEIFCKSDCEYANRNMGTCNKKAIQVVQTQGSGLTCADYEKGTWNTKNKNSSMNEHMLSGMWEKMKEKIKE